MNIKDLIDLVLYLERENQALLEENKKLNAKINKANNWVRNYIDEWSINDEEWQDLMNC
ncbi:MAG: hypothetical protein ACI31R_05550 [Bacilli bacterium]